MSYGISPYDFVQQVYYAQEKVILDFIPEDDKYKEVLMEANLVLQELQNAEDWTWLRDRLEVNLFHGDHCMNRGFIPEFDLPKWVYKPSTLNHDCLYLTRKTHHNLMDDFDSIRVPLASTGDVQYRKGIQTTERGVIHAHDRKLRAIRIGDTITFNRPFTPYERRHGYAVIDVQRRIEQFHICTPYCKGKDGEEVDYSLDENGMFVNPCARIKDRMLTEIPDPNYVIMATAARHAEGSPPALARVAGLQDAAQKIMSAMRQNDTAATDSDYQDWEVPGYIEVI